MHRTISFRRHQDWKHKRETWKRMYWLKEYNPRLIGICARTPQTCSAMCCGNMRKYEGKAKDEIIADEETLDILEELCYNSNVLKK